MLDRFSSFNDHLGSMKLSDHLRNIHRNGTTMYQIKGTERKLLKILNDSQSRCWSHLSPGSRRFRNWNRELDVESLEGSHAGMIGLTMASDATIRLLREELYSRKSQTLLFPLLNEGTSGLVSLGRFTYGTTTTAWEPPRTSPVYLSPWNIY